MLICGYGFIRVGCGANRQRMQTSVSYAALLMLFLVVPGKIMQNLYDCHDPLRPVPTVWTFPMKQPAAAVNRNCSQWPDCIRLILITMP